MILTTPLFMQILALVLLLLAGLNCPCPPRLNLGCGCTDAECNDWRQHVIAFHPQNVWQENRITRSDSCVLGGRY